MIFHSKDDVCKHFDLDPTLDVSQVIKELTKIQAKLHPDVNLDYSEKDKEMLSTIDDAKNFLREKSEQHLMQVSDILEIINLVKNENNSTKKEIEIAENEIAETSLSIIKTIKHQHLPYKITTASIWSLITLIWAFPSLITEHPIISTWVLPQTLYEILTIVWIISLFALLPILFFTYIEEKHTKLVLELLKNSDNQHIFFLIFSKHLKYLNKTTFTQNDLTTFLNDLLFNSDYRLNETLHQLYETDRELIHQLNHILYVNDLNFRKYRRVYSYATKITPKISNTIIARLLEKEVIFKKTERNWYDVYVLNE